MSEFLDVADATEFREGEMRGINAHGHDILVVRIGGEFFISDLHCPHLHGNLSHGVLDGTIVTCPIHHSRFDLADGHVVRWTDWTGVVKSMGELARHPRPLRVYASQVVDGRVLVGPEKPPVPTVE